MSDSQEDIKEINKRIKKTNKLYKNMNKCLKQLTKNSLKHSLVVKKITKLDGNCLFESICDLGYGDDKHKLRNALTSMLYEYRNYKGFFKSQPSFTPKELFDIYSQDTDLKKVIDNIMFKIVDYSYVTMCKDLSCEGSWDRICIEFVLMTISLMFDAQIKIYQDETDIELSYQADDKKQYDRIINIGYINRCHYVPLTPCPSELLSSYNNKNIPMYKLKPLKTEEEEENIISV
jgi:hypothetical protein